LTTVRRRSYALGRMSSLRGGAADFREAIEAIADNVRALGAIAPEPLEKAARLLVTALRDGGKVLAFGNGGSACDALHIEAELVNRFRHDRPGLPALALTLGAPTLTSIANDSSFDSVFERGVETLGRKGDVAIAISTSGKSRNVLRGVEAARRMGLRTIALTGRSGGPLAALADVVLCAPTDDVPRVQECHLVLLHLLCETAESAIHPKPR